MREFSTVEDHAESENSCVSPFSLLSHCVTSTCNLADTIHFWAGPWRGTSRSAMHIHATHQLDRGVGRWAGSRDVFHGSMSHESPRTPGRGTSAFLAASARNQDELCCQNPDCTAVLEVTAIPVEYEAILQRLLFSPPVAAKPGAAAPRVVEPSIIPLEDFRSAEKQGDNVTFALLVALACAPSTDAPLPLCDACMEATLKTRSRAFHDASDDRDTVVHFRDMVESRLQLSLAGDGADAGSEGAGATLPPATRAALDSALAELAAEEAALISEVAALEAAAAEAAAARAALAAQEVALAALEARWWDEFRATSRAVQVRGGLRLQLLRRGLGVLTGLLRVSPPLPLLPMSSLPPSPGLAHPHAHPPGPQPALPRPPRATATPQRALGASLPVAGLRPAAPDALTCPPHPNRRTPSSSGTAAPS